MVNGVNSNIDIVQALRASNAFKTETKPVEDKITSEVEDTAQISSMDKELKAGNNVLKSQFNDIFQEKVNEIKEIAQTEGLELTDEDINYGMRYGRSVLVNYSA